MHNASYHNPLDPHKWKRCHYCDHEGLTMIEAGAHAIVEYFEQLTEEQREDLLEKIAQKNNGE
jgi:ribosomal protein S12 methylthiotransferase accessory factor YcaO